jgi:3-phosphoshikimate 1-carboxyvinyltransferase
MLSAMGAKIEVTEEPIVLRSLASDWPLKPLEIKVPGDFSSAAFPLVGALLTPESRVHILDVGINPTRTGLLDVLRDMGARIEIENRRVIGGEPIANLIVETSSLVSTEVGGQIVPRMIDEFPILAVAATQAEGTTLIRDAAELRVKETDRIANTVAELERLGARIEERPDGFIVHGPTLLHGATVSAHGDHRLGMSLAIAGLVAKGETNVQGAESIDDSFPGFANLLVELVGERTA